MTIDEFARETAEQIRRGYNARDRVTAFEAIEAAERELVNSNISNAGRADFWEKTYQNFRSGRLLLEKQEGSALHQLMRDIERALAERQAEAHGHK